MRITAAALGATVVAGLVLASAVPAPASPPDGDRHVVTLTSGKSFTGEIVSKREDSLTLRIGSSDVVLPARMVARIEKIEREPPPPPEPEEDEPAPAPSGGRSGGGDGSAPRPAAVILKDGSIIEGYVVSRGKGVLWIIPSAEPIAVHEDEISDTVGNATPAGGGFDVTGDVIADSRRMLEDIAGDDKMRQTLAATVLDKYGAEAAPVLVEGLSHSNPLVRRQCLAILQTYRVQGARPDILRVLRQDPDPSIRTAAAASLFEWNSLEVRRALVDCVWRDRVDEVKVAALSTLARCATAEEAGALYDMLSFFEPGSAGEKAIIAGLRRATERNLADDRAVWRTWWTEEGGREAVQQKIEKIVEERGKEPERKLEPIVVPPQDEPPAESDETEGE